MSYGKLGFILCSVSEDETIDNFYLPTSHRTVLTFRRMECLMGRWKHCVEPEADFNIQLKRPRRSEGKGIVSTYGL